MPNELSTYLPNLVGTNKLSKLKKPGVWEEQENATAVEDLADGLEVPEKNEGGKKSEKDQIFSIPDPWARVILFTRALTNDKHPAHRRVLGEWRGLLTILALKEIRKFSELVAREISLDLGKMGANRPPKGSFLEMAARVRPGNKNLLLKTTTWNNFHILSWRSRKGGGTRAFAMTSPTTLVATGAYYAEVLNSAEVPWFRDPEFATPPPPKDGKEADKVLLKGGVLRAPTAEDLSDDERLALAQWLFQVHTQLSREGRGTTHSKILLLLEAFQKDMVKDLDVEELDQNKDRVLVAEKEKRVGIGGGPGSIFNFIDSPAVLEPKLMTDLMLVTTRGTQQYVLLDEDTAAELEREPRDITFYKGVSLATAARHYPSDVSSGTVDEEDKVLYCTKDFFFQPDLVFIMKGVKQADMLPRCRKAKVNRESHPCAQQRQILFPITEEAAKLYTPEELAARTTVKWESPDEAVVSFEVNVRSVGNPKVAGKVDDSPARVTIRKRYFGDALHAVASLPVIGVWPNVRFPDMDVIGKDKVRHTENGWRRYYLFESWRGGASTKDKLALRARPMEDPESAPRMVKQGEYFQITRMSRFPEVLVCETPSEVEHQNRPGTVQGLLLPLSEDKDGPPRVATRNGVLGVDFGTTGTSIYQAFYTGDGRGGETENAERVELKNRFVPITASSDEELLNLTRELFLPAKDWLAGKILSVYQDLESSEVVPDGKGGARLPVTHGHVLFADESDHRSYFPEGQRDSVHSDLKWGQREVVAKAAKDFISQLCLQSVLELASQGAKSVEVRYSYPTAFNTQDTFDFKARWQKVIQEVNDATGVDVYEGANVNENYEAVAAARYFRGRAGMTAEGGALTLDIGGGTTDIALWGMVNSKPTLHSHSSVLFAGRDIFLETLRKKPALLECIRNPNRSPEPVPEFKAAAEIKAGTSAFNALLDAHIMMYGDKLMGDTGERYSKDNRELTEFLRIVELGLCGIAFYSGLYWGRMISGQGAADKATEDEIAALQTASRIRVYVGGNGSKLMRWCGRGRFEEEAPIYTAFAASLARGAALAAPGSPHKDVEIHLSEDPKQEVAYGLVMHGSDTQKSPDFTVPMAGESFILANGEQKLWSDPLDTATLRSGAVRVGDREKIKELGPTNMEAKLPIFNAFLEVMEERVDPKDLEDIALQVNQLLTDKHSDLVKTTPKTDGEKEISDKVRNEPVFFLALKLVIKRKIEAISTRVKV